MRKVIEFSKQPNCYIGKKGEGHRPIELKFYMKTSYDRLAKIYTNCSGHKTKMATTKVYSKNPLNLFFSETM